MANQPTNKNTQLLYEDDPISITAILAIIAMHSYKDSTIKQARIHSVRARAWRQQAINRNQAGTSKSCTTAAIRRGK